MPSVGSIDEMMKCWAQKWATDRPADAVSDVFNILWAIAEDYYGSNRYKIRLDYERILGEMTAVASWLSPRPFGNSIIEAVSGCAPFSALEWLRDPSDEFAGRKHVLSQQAFLFEKLADHMRDRSKRLDSHSPEFYDYMNLFGKLRRHFEIGIYNLNYDSVARTTWPDAYCGFDDHGNFDSLGVTQRCDWGFIYHPHGSVHHSIRNYPPRIEWQNDLDGEFIDRHDSGIDMAQDFQSVPLTTLISGGNKLYQLLADPYQTFYAAFVRHVQEADAFLIAGYGFGDPHVNRVLRNRFERFDNGHISRPPVVILDKSVPQRYRTARLEINEFWSRAVKQTLVTTFSDDSGWPSDDERNVSDYIERGELEIDKGNRVAIWHGGFLEALPAVNEVTEWLSMRL